jgi:hypothetical protein
MSNFNIKVMKRVILSIGILVIGLIAESDIQAQRRNDQSRNQDKKVSQRDDSRRNPRYDRTSNNNVVIDRDGRRVVQIKNVTVRLEGYRYSNGRGNRNSFNDFDYDFRNSRRVAIARGRAPSSRHIWVNGYWEYNRGLRRDSWVAGQWTIRREYHRYQDAHYAYIGGSRLWIPGCWIRLS